MTSKIKVDNINKVSDDTTIIKKCGSTTTVGSGSGNTIVVCGSTVTIGRCGGSVALASGASQTGFGSPGQLVNWQTGSIKTATFTATADEGYFCNTTSGGFTVNLPAGSAGTIISVNDYARTFGTNALTISPNGTDKISGVNANIAATVNGQTITLIYVDSTQGWINVIDSDAGIVPSLFFRASGGTEVITGDYKTHIFTGPGTFSVTGTAPGPSGNPNAVEYLVVAGGGAGGGSPDGSSPGYTQGAGGGGGMRYNYPGTCFTGVAGSFPITVGAGGGIQPSVSGSPSTFSTITSAGGGGPSANGGAGGGGGSTPTSSGPGGLGNTPPVSPPQGANGAPRAQGRYGGAGAGGGGACGAAGSGLTGGNGTQVAPAFIGPTVAGCYGTPGPTGRYFSGGGGGALIQPSATGNGGSGGGGPGKASCSPSPGAAATSGTANTGGGGGAAAHYPGASNGGSGGSGIVMIRYKFQ